MLRIRFFLLNKLAFNQFAFAAKKKAKVGFQMWPNEFCENSHSNLANVALSAPLLLLQVCPPLSQSVRRQGYDFPYFSTVLREEKKRKAARAVLQLLFFRRPSPPLPLSFVALRFRNC